MGHGGGFSSVWQGNTTFGERGFRVAEATQPNNAGRRLLSWDFGIGYIKEMESSSGADVAILFESAESDAVLQHARATLSDFGVGLVERNVTDRTEIAWTVSSLSGAGVLVFIVGNSSADPLSERVATSTDRPVLAVPVEAGGLAPLDALRATTRGGSAPVASLAIGKAGAINAALLAVAILANRDAELRQKLARFRVEQTEKVLADRLD